MNKTTLIPAYLTASVVEFFLPLTIIATSSLFAAPPDAPLASLPTVELAADELLVTVTTAGMASLTA